MKLKTRMFTLRFILLILLFLPVTGCRDLPPNFPYSSDSLGKNIVYGSFTLRPNHFDPAQSYSANESAIIGQIYEPPLQYDYLVRPYKLTPLVAAKMPTVEYLHKDFTLARDHKNIAYTRYIISLKDNIRYQPHPAFAKDKNGKYLYHSLSLKDIQTKSVLADFPQTSTRKLVAEDFIYQIKRLAEPTNSSPILGIMQNHIVGLKAFARLLREKQANNQPYQLKALSFKGAKAINDTTYEILLMGRYPQFKYWLAMPFFAPMPWEADAFYQQKGMKEKNIVLDWYPIGTGPFYLTINNPNRKMSLRKNPNFRKETYPSKGSKQDKKEGLLADAGQTLPFIDGADYILEKESIPRWNKFTQGYYDTAQITADNFEQAVTVMGDNIILTPTMKEKDIHLNTMVESATFFWGFNMLDKVVGGYTEKARKLRQAISIALNIEDYIAIFLNGRGVPAHSPLPPGIYGYHPGQKHVNRYIYNWKNNHAERKSIAYAKTLLKEAGYPNGRDAQTGKPLILNFDAIASNATSDAARFAWMRKQLAKLSIQLYIRATHYNRFQQKMRRGDAQLFSWGWKADYPDPENFLFLFYGPNAKVNHGGENSVNYDNPEFNTLFRQMRDMENSPARLKIINKMLGILQKDAPWIWGYHPKTFTLYHHWYRRTKPNDIANNTLKYVKINPTKRLAAQRNWNTAIFWPFYLVLIILLVLIIPVYLGYRTKQKSRPLKFN